MKTVPLELNRARRRLLAGSGGLLAGGAALAAISALPAAADPGAADPDAELLALCARAEALYRRIHDLHSDGPAGIADDDERLVVLLPLYEEEQLLADEIFNMRATGLAANRARARLAIAFHGSFEYFKAEVYDVGADGLYLAALVRDLAAGGAI